jgi:YHS domain-containing protein
MAQVEDPVCGMMIEPNDAAGSSAWAGKTYYFCSTECKEKFDADPEDYASGRRRDTMDDGSQFKKMGSTPTPKFGSAGSGGAEFERGPDQRR